MRIAIAQHQSSYSKYIYWGVVALFVFLIIRYQIRLLDYFEWGDESETIVTAKMMAAGYRLYSEVFNMHGPLTFLPGYILEQFGSFGIKSCRIVMMLMQWAALGALYFSPLLQDRWNRCLYIVVAATFNLALFSNIFAHTYTYQAIAGLLLVIILSQYVLPSIAEPKLISRSAVLLANALLMSLPFLAITYIPAALFLFLAAFRVSQLRDILLGLVLGLFFNLLFLGFTGSFAGYAAIHFYLNLKVVPLFLGGASPVEMLQTAWLNASSGLQAIFASVIVVLGSIRLATGSNSTDGRYAMFRAILFFIAIESLLLRGSGFQGLPYWYALTAIPLIFFKDTFFTGRKYFLLAVLVIVTCLIKLLIILPDDKARIRSKPVPKYTPFSELVKRYTNKDDRILAYSFQNHQYILADRLPGSANFFFLPWQAKYSQQPVLGVKLDVCGDIKKSRPKMLLIDKMNVDGQWAWNSYAQCVQEIMDQDYQQIKGTHYYIRNDAFPKELEAEKS